MAGGTSDNIDRAVEEKALRDSGMLGSGGTGHHLFAIEYTELPPEALHIINLISNGGPFPHPRHDGKPFGNRFGDLPTGSQYLEFTVPTPGCHDRGARRIVARLSGVLFFTACHYERVQGRMSQSDRLAATALLDEQWRNGFYVITGMPSDLRARIAASVKHLHSLL